MIKTFHKTICILLLPLLLTSCWDYRDIDKRSIELAIGVDEVNDKLEFTGEIAKLPTGGGKAEITEVYKYYSLGKNFEGSRANFDARATAPDFPGAVRAVVFSKNYAETEGIESYVNRLYYIPDFRSSVLLAVSKDPTNEFFNGEIINHIAIGYALEDTIKSLSEKGSALYKTLQQVKADIEFKDIGYFVPYVTKEDNAVKYLGLAVMKGSKLIDTVNHKDSNGFLFVLSKNPIATIPIPYPSDEKNLVGTKSFLKQRKIKTSYKNNKVNISIDLKFNTQLQYLYEFKSISKEDIIKFEKIISDQIKKEVVFALELSINQFQCDVFGFARYFKAENPEEYKQINWEQMYPDINFNVNVKTTIINTNLLDAKAKK
jgi:spore germination protein KC